MSLSYKLRYLRSLKVATGVKNHDLVVSRSQTLGHLFFYCATPQRKGLGPFPGDDVGEAINTNRDALISTANVGRAVLVRETMALALEDDLRTVIGEVSRWHGYERLKEEQLSGVEKFVSGQNVFVSQQTGFE